MPFLAPNGTWARTRSNKEANQVLSEQDEWQRVSDEARRRRSRLGNWVRGVLAVGVFVGVLVLVAVQAFGG